MGDVITRTEFLEYMEAFEARLNNRFDEEFGAIRGSMKIQFEETHALIRLSLEGLEALRETTERGFVDVRARLDDNTDLLKSAVQHVRGRVERLERRT